MIIYSSHWKQEFIVYHIVYCIFIWHVKQRWSYILYYRNYFNLW